MKQFYSLDGGRSFHECHGGVRVLYGGLYGDNDTPVELLVNCTEEGVIMDVLHGGGENGSTSSEKAQEIVERLEGI